MPPLLQWQFSSCKGPRLALISVPSHKIPSVADIILFKTVYIHEDGNLTCKKNQTCACRSSSSTTSCAVSIIYSFMKRVGNSAIGHLRISRAVYLGVELVALLFLSHAWVKVKSLWLWPGAFQSRIWKMYPMDHEQMEL